MRRAVLVFCLSAIIQPMVVSMDSKFSIGFAARFAVLVLRNSRRLLQMHKCCAITEMGEIPGTLCFRS
jgi:hypothetical protein